MKVEKLILSTLLERKNWEKFGDLFPQSFFDSSPHKELFYLIKEYWEKADKEVGTLKPKVLSGFISSRARDKEHENVLLGTLRTITEDMPGSTEIQPIVREALYHSAVKNEILTTIEHLETNTLDLDRTILNLNKIQRALDLEEEEVSPITDVEKVIQLDIEGSKYPTGIPSLDDKLNGGLWHGEIGLIIAPPFRGKTQTLINLGANQLKHGGDLFHATCEISRNRTGIRYYQNLLSQPREWVIYNPKEVATSIQKMGLGNWEIRDYSSTKVSTSKVRHDLMRFLDRGATNPLVIIDYADFIKPSSKYSFGESRLAVRDTVAELRQIASELDLGIWTASQSNRASYKENKIGMGDVAESVGKIEVADVILTLNQSDMEKSMGVGNYLIEKARERVIRDPMVQVRIIPEYQSYEEHE